MDVKAVWCLPLFVMLVVGCSDHDADKVENDAKSIANDAGKAAQDAAKKAGTAAEGLGLAASVHTVLWLRKGVDTDDLHVDAHEGTVTLTGHVKSEAEKQLIDDTVNGTKGVERLEDKLVVAK